jgi:hypothetical protein
LFLLFINYVKAQRIVDASCQCLHVAAAASGRFRPGKNIGNTSLYLWALIPLGGTGAHSDRVPLLLVAEAMFWGDSVVVFIVAICRHHDEFAYFRRGNLFDEHLQNQRNHYLNPFAPTNTLIRRLCPRPPNPYIVGKPRISAFLHVVLVWGITLISLLIKKHQS